MHNRRKNKKPEIFIFVVIMSVFAWWNYSIITLAQTSSDQLWQRQRTRVVVRQPFPIAKTEDGRVTGIVASGLIVGDLHDQQTMQQQQDLEQQLEEELEQQHDDLEALEKQEAEELPGVGHDAENQQQEQENEEEDSVREAAMDEMDHVISTTELAQDKNATMVENQGLSDFLNKLEKEISYWAHGDKRDVIFWGSELFHKWYFRTWSRAFTKIGFKVLERKSYGALPTKDIPKVNRHNAVFCLTYEISGCFNTVSSHSKLARYHRINMATFLRETLWNKGNFCRTIEKATMGNPYFDDYVFKCWINPEGYSKALDFANANPEEKFIIKPLASGGGKGIHVVDSLDSIRTKKPLIIQNFLHNPHLIKGYKWDLRAYAVVTSMVPLRAYLYSRGLVRFASTPFNSNAKNGGKKSQYLTNISLGTKWKKQNVTSITWSFDDLKTYMNDQQDGMYEKLMDNVLGAVSVVFLSAEQEWRRLYEKKGDACSNCYKHFGLDIIIDANMNARVIEANGQPGMTLSGDWNDHYSTTKLNMVRDLIAMVYSDKPVADELVAYLEDIDMNLLETLTEADWEYLIRYLQERHNMGGFLQVYPNSNPRLKEMHKTLLEQQPSLQKRFTNRLALHKILEFLESKFV